MHQRIAFILLVFTQLFYIPCSGQFNKSVINSDYVIAKVVNTPSSEIKKADVRAITETESLNWERVVQHVPFQLSHKGPDPVLFYQIKNEKNAIKESGESVFDNTCAVSPDAVIPMVYSSFESNLPLEGTPPDNSIAISNAGIIVSAINSNLVYFNTKGEKLYSKTFYDFLADENMSGKLYDPQVYYDSRVDRFIFVLLHGSHSSNSTVIACFSKTSNPMDGWNIYYIKTTDMHASFYNKWFDFPKIGVSNDELFITGNIFKDDVNEFSESVIIQIDKNTAYQAKSMSWKLWNNLQDGDYGTPFSLLPVSWGKQGSYGPGIYLLSNKNTGNSTVVYLYDLTAKLNDNPKLVAYKIAISKYDLAGDAIQKYVSPASNPGLLNIGDCRIQNAFYQISNGQGIIHFVFHSEYNYAYNGINYNRLNVPNLTIVSKSYGASNMDFSYPAIASASPEGSMKKDVIIAFLASSSDFYPEIRVIHCDDDMNFSSSTIVKEGETYVNILMGMERWGDYTGIARKHNTSAPRIWISGCFGGNIRDNSTMPPISKNNQFRTWIAEVSQSTVSSDDISEMPVPKVHLYPNPVRDRLALEFTMEEKGFLEVEIWDMTGRLIKKLYSDYAPAGSVHLSFNKEALGQGTYLLQVKTGQKIITHEKILVY